MEFPRFRALAANGYASVLLGFQVSGFGLASRVKHRSLAAVNPNINKKSLELSLKQIFWFTLPALAVGLALRLFLMVNMPYAFVISDTREFLDPGKSAFSLSNPLKSSSRTFLAKKIYSAPMDFGQPILPFIATVQHFFGLGMIFAAGLLCALWTKFWKLWIIPLTTLVAVHPTILWYEHMSLPDSTSVMLILATAAAGGFYYLNATKRRLIVLTVVLFLAAGARQEGFLFLPFGVVIVMLRHYKELQANRRRIALVAGVCLFAFLGNQTSQGGQMLLTSTVHMAPEKLWWKKGFSEEAAALRDFFKPQWPSYPNNHNKSRKIIVKKAQEYLESQPGVQIPIKDRANNNLCKGVALEIALRNFWRMPAIAYHKFLATRLEPPSPGFDAAWLHKKHISVMYGGRDDEPPKDRKNMEIYFGRSFSTREEFTSWVEKVYPVEKLQWLDRFQEFFVAKTVDWGFPDRVIDGQPLPGLPYLYFFGFLGLLIGAGMRSEMRPYRIAWILLMVLQAFVVFSASSLRSRYRLSYEPWWFLGLFCLLDFVALLAVNAWKALFQSEKGGQPVSDQSGVASH